MFTIVLNGEDRKIKHEVTLDQLLDLFSLPRQRVAVELNKQVVKRSEWERSVISDRDVIEVIHVVGGG
jgi:sulfur carrier protein